VLQLVEAVHPTVAVKRKTRLGLERALGEGDLRRVAEIPEREASHRLDVVGIWVLPDEAECEVGGPLELEELAALIEAVGLRRLHLDPIAPSDTRLEPQARNGEALRPPPLRELRRVAEGAEHDRTRGRKQARQGESELTGWRRHAFPHQKIASMSFTLARASSIE
jgi:hypothetical protein